MREFIAFMKKEIIEQMRSSKVMIILILSVMFGVMNPAVAKLTPMLLEMLSEEMAESGMVITLAEITAMDSWVQFYKNIPMALIVFVLMEGGILCNEYKSCALVLALTRGIARYKVVLSKTVTLLSLWTAYYFLCFGITYAYNAYYWDNSVAESLAFSVVVWWLFGVFVIALTVMLSVVFTSVSAVYVGVGASVFAMYLASLIPKFAKYMPIYLTDGNSLIYGALTPNDYYAALAITCVLSVILFLAAVPVFNKKQL